MTKNVHDLSAIETTRAIKDRTLSATDVVEGLIARIEEQDAEVQAWAFLDANLARARAASIGERADIASLPLAGVAVGVKDIIDTADMPTENGTILDAGRRPSTDAAVVRLLREAGAIVMGKTATTELAFMQPSKTRNPRNPAHTPGGSSSGSAAAVASSMVPVALGTQTNGSVIRPASFCGVYALKPTNGLIPRLGVLEEAGSFDTVGVFARSLEDTAAVADVLAQGGNCPPAPGSLLQAARTPSTQPRFAFVKTPAWTFAEDATKEAFETFAKALGADCEEVHLPTAFDQVIPYHRTAMLAEVALNFGPYYERGKESLSAAMRNAVEQGRALSAVAYAEALRARDHLYEEFIGLIEPYAAVITPPAIGPAPKGLDTTGNPVFCTFWTYLGMPALNLPLLKIGDMPLGVQLAGRRFEEGKLFSSAAALLAHSSLRSVR